MSRYLIPAALTRVEHEVARSRFIATLAMADSTEAARALIAAVRAEMPDATHHVYAFQVGYGSSVTEGLSDDGEPSGTSGPPVLAVLRGAGIGDAVIVVTRYYGGTKLGTGGLVRAYGDAARLALAQMTTREKVELIHLSVTLPYSLYTLTTRLAPEYEATISEETFAGEVTLRVSLPTEQVEGFAHALREISAGQVIPVTV